MTYELIYSLAGRRESMLGEFETIDEAEDSWRSWVADHPEDGPAGAEIIKRGTRELVRELDPIEPS